MTVSKIATSFTSKSAYIGAGRQKAQKSSQESIYSKQNSKNNKKTSETSALDSLISLIASIGITISSFFGAQSATQAQTKNTSDDYSDVVSTAQNEDYWVALDEAQMAQQIQDELDSANLYSNGAGRVVRNDYYSSSEELLNDIYSKDESASEHLSSLSNALNMSESEVSRYLINLSQSEQFGNGCINPLTFYAQICQESNCNPNVEGDYSKKQGKYLALGFGQFHTCAVDEVNRQIKNGTYGDYTYNNGEDYTYEDRSNPKKSLEMMALLLRYDASKTDDENGMLAMYNQGNKNGINTKDGQNYVAAVLGRIS